MQFLLHYLLERIYFEYLVELERSRKTEKCTFVKKHDEKTCFQYFVVS